MADEKSMRNIILLGGDYTGRLGEAAQDYVYIVESVPALAKDASCSTSTPCEESLNLLGDYRRARKFNATGRFEAVGSQDYEVYEFAGNEDHSIFVEAQV
jgi:hypothetical protein